MFISKDNEDYKLWHEQDCCETVGIDDVCGDLEDLSGTPIIMAEESHKETSEDISDYNAYQEWTFYRFRTIKGIVSIRFAGYSNGCYSARAILARAR